MPLTQKWLQQGLGIEQNVTDSHHHFQEWINTTFYIINIKANTPKCALVGNSMVFKPPITNMCNIINKENSTIITLAL